MHISKRFYTREGRSRAEIAAAALTRAAPFSVSQPGLEYCPDEEERGEAREAGRKPEAPVPQFPRPEDAVRPSTWAGPGTSIPAPGHPPSSRSCGSGYGASMGRDYRAWQDS